MACVTWKDTTYRLGEHRVVRERFAVSFLGDLKWMTSMMRMRMTMQLAGNDKQKMLRISQRLLAY
jgi:hypothetical protein